MKNEAHMNAFNKYASSICLGIILFIVIFFSMLTPPIRGIANQGDFERMMIWAGVTYQNNSDASSHFHWVNRYFDLKEIHMGDVYSSEIGFLWISRCINKILHTTAFDLNVLGIIQTIFFCIVISLTYYYLKKIHKLFSFLFIPFAIFILTDIGYTAYFNSFYQESSGIIFLFLTLAVILKIISENNKEKGNTNLILYIISSLLLITAKSQYFILFIPIVCTLFMLFNKSISKKILLTLGLCMTTFSLLYYFFGTPKIIKTWNVYNSVFPQILSATTDQERAMRILNLEPKFSTYSGIFASQPDSGVNNPDLEKFLTPRTFPKIILYYLMTPQELISVSKEIVRRSFTTTVWYLGYYEDTSGAFADKQPVKNNAWSTFKKTTLIHYQMLVIPFILLVCIGSIYVYIRKKNQLSVPIFFAASCAICQLFIIAFSEGVSGGVEKFLLLFDICFDILIYILLVSVCQYVYTRIHTKKEKEIPTLSFLISIFSDRTRQFEMSLRSLTSYPYDSKVVELLIFIDYVDSKPILQILKKYRKYFSSITVFVVTKKRASVNHSASRRNFLATQAKGEYIVFSEPELFHVHDTIQCFLLHSQNHEARMWISGPIYAAEDVVNAKGELIDRSKSLKNFQYILNLVNKENLLKNREFKKYFHVINSSLYTAPFYCTMFNRNYFLSLKGLNQNLKVRGYEDMEFYDRFTKDGGKVIIDESIKTIHLPHSRSLDKESQVSWNLYNSTVIFNPLQKIGAIADAEYKMIPIL